MCRKIVLHVMVWCSLLFFGADQLHAQKIYWADSLANKIQRSNLDGTNVEDIITTDIVSPSGIAIHFQARKLYWLDVGTGNIKRADMDGSNIETIVTESCCFDDIVIDPYGEKIYWTFKDDFISGIQRANLDGSDVEHIVPLDSVSVRGIDIDPVEKKMYWIYHPAGIISRSNLDGTELVFSLIDGLQRPLDIAINHISRKMYWTGGSTGVNGEGKIRRANLDGTNMVNLLTELDTPSGIEIDAGNGKIYWSEFDQFFGASISRADLDGTNVELLVSGLQGLNYLALDIALVDPPVPTVSQWGMASITLLLMCGGTLILRRRIAHPPHSRFCNTVPFVAAILLAFVITENVSAQSNVLPASPTTIIDVNVDSGLLDSAVVDTNVPESNLSDARVLFSHNLSIPGAPWMRLHFKNIKLTRSDDHENQSYLRITSMKDGDHQILTAMDLIYWGNSSAYFNGDEVQIELIAYPDSGENRIVIDKVLTTDFGSDPNCTPGIWGICGSTDDRIVSTESGVGRLRYQKKPNCDGEIMCTAFLINGQHCGFLTAGHCCEDFIDDCPLFKSVVEFNVPSSDLDGAINVSLIKDQYPIDTNSSVQYSNPFPNDGEDYCYFGTYPSRSFVKRTPLESGVGSLTLATVVPPADNSTLRISGYGRDSDPPGIPSGKCNEFNHTLQSDTGPYTNLNGTIVEFPIDTRPINSGSPVIHESSGEVYAIFTDGLCPTTDNLGTAVDHPGLLAFLANPQGLCGDCNNNGIQDCKDLANFTETDCNADGILDSCQPEEDLSACCLGYECINDLTYSQCMNLNGIFFSGKACCPWFCQTQ